jgi:protein-disulfide isomerase
MSVIYRNQSRWSLLDAPETLFYRYAKQIGLRVSKFKRDYNGYAVAARIEQDLSRARSLKLNSTPSVFVNGTLLSYADALELERLIAESNK